MGAVPGTERLMAMDPEERRAFCRSVLESLSEIVEGTAPEELRARVEEVLGRCQPYLAMRDTLPATIELLRAEGRRPDVDEDAFRRAVDAARRRLDAE